MSGLGTTRRFHVAAAIVGIIALVSPSSALARHELPVVGSGGNVSAKVECPFGQVLQGFSGGNGVWINSIQAVCAPVDGGQPVVYGQRFGGAGGGLRDGFCPKGARMGRGVVISETTKSRQVATILFTCHTASGQVIRMSYGNPAYRARCTGIDVIGSCSINPNVYEQACEPGEVPTGFGIRYGQDVNAIGLICGHSSGFR